MKAQSVILLALLSIMAVLSNAQYFDITPGLVDYTVGTWANCILNDEDCGEDGAEWKEVIQFYFEGCTKTICNPEDPEAAKFMKFAKLNQPEFVEAAINRFSQ